MRYRNEILGDHCGSVACRGLVLRHRGASYEARGKPLIVKADDLLTAFLSLERDAIAPKGANGNATRAWVYAPNRNKGEVCQGDNMPVASLRIQVCGSTSN